MKKILLSVMLLFATSIMPMLAGNVILNPTGNGNGANNPNKPRTPAAPIYVDQDGTTLTFDRSCFGCSVTLMDEDENIVFTTVVDENGIVELPESLAGTFILQMERGSIVFVGEIELSPNR